MLIHGVPVARLGSWPKVDHRPVKPAFGSVSEPKASVLRNPLTAGALRQQLVPHRSGCRDSSVDRPPALFACDVFESDLAHP